MAQMNADKFWNGDEKDVEDKWECGIKNKVPHGLEKTTVFLL